MNSSTENFQLAWSNSIDSKSRFFTLLIMILIINKSLFIFLLIFIQPVLLSSGGEKKRTIQSRGISANRIQPAFQWF